MRVRLRVQKPLRVLVDKIIAVDPTQQGAHAAIRQALLDQSCAGYYQTVRQQSCHLRVDWPDLGRVEEAELCRPHRLQHHS